LFTVVIVIFCTPHPEALVFATEGKDEAEGEAAVRRAGAEIEVVARSGFFSIFSPLPPGGGSLQS